MEFFALIMGMICAFALCVGLYKCAFVFVLISFLSVSPCQAYMDSEGHCYGPETNLSAGAGFLIFNIWEGPAARSNLFWRALRTTNIMLACTIKLMPAPEYWITNQPFSGGALDSWHIMVPNQISEFNATNYAIENLMTNVPQNGICPSCFDSVWVSRQVVQGGEPVNAGVIYYPPDEYPVTIYCRPWHLDDSLFNLDLIKIRRFVYYYPETNWTWFTCDGGVGGTCVPYLYPAVEQKLLGTSRLYIQSGDWSLYSVVAYTNSGTSWQPAYVTGSPADREHSGWGRWGTKTSMDTNVWITGNND